jgi:hypothetical protein
MGEVHADAQGRTRCWWTRTGKVYTPFSPDRFVTTLKLFLAPQASGLNAISVSAWHLFYSS